MKGNHVTAQTNSLKRILLAGSFLAAGVTAIVAFSGAWPRTSNTSPLMALFVLLWGCACILTAVLTWRRSRFAGLAFLAAVGLLLLPARYIAPGSQIFLPSFVAIVL